MANPGLFFVYFAFYHKVESNSDHTDLSRPLDQLDHHHGPRPRLTLNDPSGPPWNDNIIIFKSAPMIHTSFSSRQLALEFRIKFYVMVTSDVVFMWFIF